MAADGLDCDKGRKSLEMETSDATRQNLAASGENAPRRTRTYNPLIKSQTSARHKSLIHHEKGREASNVALSLPYAPPDLAQVVDAWPTLPEVIRAAILALVQTSMGKGGGP